MAAETLRIDGLTEDETVTLNLLVKQLHDRMRRNKLRADLYDGRNAIKKVGTVIPPQYYRLGLALGWAAKGVDGLARRCRLYRMVWKDGDLDDLGMQDLADANFLFSELAQARTDSLIHGVSFLVTTRGEDDEPKVLVHARDALNATGTFNARTRRLDDFLSVTSWDGNRVTGFNLYMPGVIVSAEKSQGKWELIDRQEHRWGVPVEPLIYRSRPSRRTGRSRITRAAMSHQFAALRALVRLEGHMDIYAIPQLILLGASDRIFKNPDGSYKASWQVALGRVLGIPDDEETEDKQLARADVKHISAQSPQPHIADLNALAKLEAREFDLPDHDFALTDMANPTSAEAYDKSLGNLIAEAEGAMDDWSVPIRRTVTRALAMWNDENEVPGAWSTIKPKWGRPEHVSRAAEADAGAKQLAAVPWLADEAPEVALELLGLDDLQIERALAARRRAAGRAVLAALAAADQGVTDGNGDRV